MKRILVVNDYDGLYSKFWENLGEIHLDTRRFLEDPHNFHLVCFTGGEDVSPELYGHRNLASGNSPRRDEAEKVIFEAALMHGIPMTGICRGSQFLNVMCGGTMVQHLKASHGGSHHLAHTKDHCCFEVTSSHHQMSVPGPEGQVLSWADETVRLDQMVYGGNLLADLGRCGSVFPNGETALVTEAIYYPKRRVFGVQHHPEWQRVSEEAPQWTLRMIRELLFGEKVASIS